MIWIYILNKFLDSFLSMKWLWIIVIILFRNIAYRTINAYKLDLNIKKQYLTKDTDYDEEKIIAHINYIIQEALDQYVLLNINPTNIYYINSKREKEILEYLTNTVPDRISPALMGKLSLMYNQSYVPTFLGNHIYMVVTNYVIQYNLEQTPDKMTARSQNNENKKTELSEE